MFSPSRRILTPSSTLNILAPRITRAFAAMAAPVTQSQIDIVKATAPVLKEHGNNITTVFYNNMLAAHPELKNVFNMTSQKNGRQPRALAASVLAYAQYIDNLPVLTSAVERIAQKHASLFVAPDQYDIVGNHLIGAIGQVLGDAATPEIVDAWTAAYGALAHVFIDREAQLYNENGTWNGWRKFKVAKKVPESNNIISLHLEPSDGVKLPSYLPGQYISLQVKLAALGHLQSRQYSMSIAPRNEGDYYRVSVKREEGAKGSLPPGLVSNMLHDEIQEGDELEVSHPQGEFFVDPADESRAKAPMVLMSAGVGATPMMSILQAVAGNGRPISWVQAAMEEARMPFIEEVKAIVKSNKDRVKASVFLESGGVAGPLREFATGYDGRIVLEKLDQEQDLFLRDRNTQYYLCGPEEWMVAMRKALVGLGVEKRRIALELFNTGDVADE